MIFAVLFLLVSITSLSPAEQTLHPHPVFPTNEEFLRVNQAVEAACAQHPEIDKTLVWSLIWQESKYDSLALGSKGEVGLGQLMPSTAERLGVKDRTDIDASVQATVNLLAHLSQKYKHNVRLMLAAYNSGEPRVDMCKCVPPASLAYVNAIDENRHFAQQIVDYVKSTVVPTAAQTALVSKMQEQQQQLSAELTSSMDKKQISDLESRINQLQSRLRRTQDQQDRLRKEALSRTEEIASEVNPAADGSAAVVSLNGAIRELETKGARGENDVDALAAASDLNSQVSSLQATLAAHDALTDSTKQQIADLTARLERLTRLYGVTSEAPRLTGAKKIHNRQPTVALVAAASTAQGPVVDQVLSAALQDTLLRHRFAVNVELQNENFIAQHLAPLLNGDGNTIRHWKRHSGPKWDYVVVVELSGSSGTPAMSGMNSFQATAESRVYNNRGVLLTTRSFSATGAGFSEQQAREAAAARLAKMVGDYVTLAVQSEPSQEETAP